jgi:structure-specific endonuclease subunit SLX1
MKDRVEKANNIVSFEREGSCVHCHEALEPGRGLYPICTNEGCESIGHLACWSKYAQGALRNRDIIPLNCKCPLCGGQIRWGDMMKELTLRVRGEKDVEKLLKKRRGAKT